MGGKSMGVNQRLSIRAGFKAWYRQLRSVADRTGNDDEGLQRPSKS